MASVRQAVLLLTFAAPALLSGCGTIRGTSGTTMQLVDRNGVDMIAAPAGHVSMAIKDATSAERICGGRMPDAIMDSSMALSLPIKGVGVGSSNTDLALGGRNPQVLIIRELLYRLCEITLNSNLPPNEVVGLYKDTLPMVSLALKTSMGGTASISVVGDSPAPPTPSAAAAAPSQNPYTVATPASNLDAYSSSAGGITPSSGITPSGGITSSGGITPSGDITQSGGITPASGAVPASPDATSGGATPAAGGTGTPQN